MITSKLVYRQLMKNKKRTMLTLFFIILSVAMFTSIAMFYKSADQFLSQNNSSNKGDILFLFSSCGILEFIILTSAILVITNAFSISANERIRQFGILKSVGATREQIERMGIIEALMLSAVAIPLGILAGFIIEVLAVQIVNNLLYGLLHSSGRNGKLHIVFPLSVSLFSATLSFGTVMVSAWFPAKKVSKISAMDAIRLTREIKINPKGIKTPKFVEKIFGVEGILADKSLKRNKRKYYVTIISLTLSVAIFIGGFSFSENLNRVIQLRYPDTDFPINVQVTLRGKRIEPLEKVADSIRKIDGAKTWLSYTCVQKISNTGYFLNPNIEEISENNVEGSRPNMVQIHSLSWKYYKELCEELAIETEDFPENGAIWIENVEGWETPYFKKNMVINFGEEKEYSALLMGKTDQIPKGVVPLFGSEAINILVPENAFFQYHKEDTPLLAILSARANELEAFTKKLQEIQKQQIGEVVFDKIYEIEKKWQQERNTSFLITLFVMGFASILAVLALISAIGTISADMTFQWQEFAMLQSVGMTKKELQRMLNYKSFFYSIKALFFGILTGIIISFLSYRALLKTFTFGYLFPLKSIWISGIILLCLIFFTMRYGSRKMKQWDVIETIRTEII